jgi:hypothetical protein
MEQKGRDWSKILLIFVGIAAVLSLSGGVYFLAFGKAEDDSVTDSQFLNATVQNTPTTRNLPKPSQVTPQPTISSVSLQDTEDKNKWKEYRTKSYHISYPQNWKVKYYQDVPNGVQLYLPDPDKKPSSSSGVLAPSQYVTLVSTITKQTVAQYVDRIQVTCCIGPSTTASQAASFQKVTIVIGGRAGMAYKTPTNVAATWNIVMSNGSEIVDLFSSITDLYAVTLANQIINTFAFLK